MRTRPFLRSIRYSRDTGEPLGDGYVPREDRERLGQQSLRGRLDVSTWPIPLTPCRKDSTTP